MTGSFRSRPRDRRLDAPSEADQYLRSRFVAATAPSLESSMLALAWMYLGGASFAIAVIALAQRDRLTDPTIGTCIVLAYAIGVALLAGRRRLPSPAIDFGLAAGIMFVTVAVAKLGHHAEQYFSILYVWSALNSAFLLPRRRAALQLGLIASSFAIYLVATDATTRTGIQQWLLTVGTAVLAAGLVGLLKGRVERLIHQVAETAKRDPRTGLLNGSGFEELL